MTSGRIKASEQATARGTRSCIGAVLLTALAAPACADGDTAADAADEPNAIPVPYDPLQRQLAATDRYAQLPWDDTCGAGEHVVLEDERGCVACEARTYSSGPNASACLAWSVCLPGQYVEHQPSRTADRVCVDCAPGTHSTHDNSPRCASDGTCAPGTYAVDASSSQGVVCEECPEGTWNDSSSAAVCQAPSTCAAGSWVKEDFESTHDRRCDACPAGTYSDAPNPAGCTVCDPGSHCPAGSSEPEACAAGTWDDDGDPSTGCQSWTECGEGFREVSAGTSLTDRECSPGQWYHQLGEHGGEEAPLVQVDATGDVYVAANTFGDIDGQGSRGGSDVFVRKLSGATGTEIWRVQFGSTGDDSVSSIALDPAGALVIASAVVGGNASVRKLSANDGESMWTVQLETGSPKLDVSANGDIVVAARLSLRNMLRKMNAAGVTLWEVWLEDSAGGGSGVAFDSAGNVAVSYSTDTVREGEDYSHNEAYVSLLSGDDAAQLWTSRLDFGWSSSAGEIASDGADRLVVRVDATPSEEEAGAETKHVALLDIRNGALVWSRTYDQSGSIRACFDASGDILVETNGISVQSLSRQDGSELWTTAVASAEYGPTDVAGTASGDVVIAGSDSPDLILTALLRGSDRSEQWRDSITTGRTDALYSVAFDGSGDVIVGGSTETAFEREAPNLQADALVRKLSGVTGDPLWTRQFGSDGTDAIYAVRADALGNVVVGGGVAMDARPVVGEWDAFVSKLSGSDGTTLWSTQIASSTREAVEALAIDSLGDAIVTGYTGRDSDPRSFGAYARKLSGVDGSLLWETILADADRFAWTAPSVGVMPNGDAIASWTGLDDHSGVLRLSAVDGSIVWEVAFDSATANFDGDLAVDAAGDVALLGPGDTVVKLSGEDGSELWTVTAEARSIAFDAAGNLVVGGDNILRLSGSDGSWLGYSNLDLGEFSNITLAVSTTGDVVLAGSHWPKLSEYRDQIDLDGFVVKLLR